MAIRASLPIAKCLLLDFLYLCVCFYDKWEIEDVNYAFSLQCDFCRFIIRGGVWVIFCLAVVLAVNDKDRMEE